MKQALVTGAGGFIGSHLTENLRSSGWRVRAFVHYNSRGSWGWLDESNCPSSIEVIAGDIRDADIVRSAVRGVDTVFHLAALIGIPYSYHSPEAYVETNVKGTLNLLQASRDRGVSRFIHTSTSEVYGTAQFVPIPETHPINPQSPYAASKAAADFLALSFHRSFGLPVTVIRPFNTFGPRQSARAVIPTIITQLLTGKKTVRLGSLFPTRDLTFVNDTVDAFIQVAGSEKAVGRVINAGSDSEISMGDLARLTARIMGVPLRLASEQLRKRPAQSEVERLRADNSAAKSILGWAPKHSLEKGLEKTIAWFRKEGNLERYKAGIYSI